MPGRIAATLMSISCGFVSCAGQAPAPIAIGPLASRPAATAPAGELRPHGAMLRYPDVSQTDIVFVYANDLWLVPREGGVATPLASPPGPEMFPKFSPDGAMIAFVGNYEGNRDLYTVPARGGIATRVTHHPATETLCGWTPDGELLFYTYGFAGLRRQTQLFTVPPSGGLPAKLPVPYGANGTISRDGQWLAYTPHSRDDRTWKRYRGGMATDIWLFNLSDHTSRKITDWEGTDSLPMWHGQTVYYLSDADSDHKLNIWAYDVQAQHRRQVTRFTDYDVKWPSIGPESEGQGEIVFQNGSDLYLLDLASGAARVVEVTIPGDRPTIRPHDIDAKDFIADWDISSTGQRAVVEARGDIWTVPGKKGSPRNLTRTSGAAERDPAWSPDGRWIAYFSDATGEYELCITQSDGKGETRQLTAGGGAFRYDPTFSPDSKHVAFTDQTGAIYLHTIEANKTKLIDADPWAIPRRVNWAPDSAWIAYGKAGENLQSAIWLYNLDSDQKHQVTSGRFEDWLPTFDRKGDYLFFVSYRDFSSPTYEDVGSTFVYANTGVLLAVPLRAEVGPPWPPKSDEETWDKDEEKKDNGKDDEDAQRKDGAKTGEGEKGDGQDKDRADDAEKKDKESESDEKAEEREEDGKEEKEIKPVDIELEGFEHRAVRIPVDKGMFPNLAVAHDGKLIYVRGVPRGSDAKPSIKILDLSEENEKKEEKTVLDEVDQFVLSADGKKLLVRKDETMAIVDAAADQKLDKPIPLGGMTATIAPREEWKQIFTEAWRIQRDFFYDPHMHGVDWEAARRRYAAMLDDCVSREDVSFVIGEMIAELNVGHAYVWGAGDVEEQPEVSVGMLGADFELHEGAYRITKIYQGAPWDVDARGPLRRPGVNVEEGDYLLAVNGVPVDPSKDPWAALQGLGGRVVTITVSDQPTLEADEPDPDAPHDDDAQDDEAAGADDEGNQADDDAEAAEENPRDVVVELLSSEEDLRYRDWIENKRAYVEEKTGGKVGYIYVPNTGISGQSDLFRQFYGQVDEAALIIDERWNAGGQIPTRFIELLNRPRTNYWARRHGKDWPTPADSHQGPKCMLINGMAGSGGDCFPYYFRQAGLGKLIGTRTWGGLVGISGNPRLIDGGAVTAPTFAFYETDGTWGVEGHGVDPDIEVIDDPALMVDGGDPQLDAAIEHMMQELARHPYVKPPRPPYPNRSGMGVRSEDK